MKEGGVLNIVDNHKVALPDTNYSVGLLKDPKEDYLFDTVQFNQKLLQSLAVFLYQKEQLKEEGRRKKLQRTTQEIVAAESYIKVYNEMRVIQENLLKTLETRMKNAKSIIEAKEKEYADTNSTLAAKQADTANLKSEIEGLLKNQLNSLTKDITEAVIREIHYILSNEPKDPKQINIVNSIIILLRNSKAVDHVTVNSYLTHYEGFLQKLIGFTGVKISREMAEEINATATKFCEEYDDTLPQNQGKKIPKKYKVYLPLARWIKLATQIALKQAISSHIEGELKKSSTRISIVSSELAELAEICKEGEKELATSNEALADIHKFIGAAIQEKEAAESCKVKLEKETAKPSYFEDLMKESEKTKEAIENTTGVKTGGIAPVIHKPNVAPQESAAVERTTERPEDEPKEEDKKDCEIF